MSRRAPSKRPVESEARHRAGPDGSAADVRRLVHELQVHQIELETQNAELRSARLEAENARAQYLGLFQAAPAGYVILNGDGVIVDCNAAAVGMLRRTRPQQLNVQFESFVSRTDRMRLVLHLSAARERRRAHCELHLELPNGRSTLVRLDTSPIASCDDNFLLVLTDMSERQRDQELLEGLNRDLESRVAERTAELKAQNEQLQAEIEARAHAEHQRRELETRLREAERLQSLGMLAAGVAHDFNNLLVGVVGNAEVLLQASDLPESARAPLKMIVRTGNDASELTRQLLVFAGQGGIDKSTLDLSEVISRCVELLRPRFGAGIHIALRLANEREVISADRSQIQRVLVNLLTNAFEAMDGHGSIDVGTRLEWIDAASLAQFQHAEAAVPGAYVIIHVADTGRGIDPASVTRIFEPFFSTKFTGRGLGLATVLGVVQSHAGAIRVISGPGEGTRFEIALPRAANDVTPQLHTPPVNLKSNPPGESAFRKSASVLLIDDDDQVRFVIAQLLRAIGLEVTVADGGEAGLALIGQHVGRFDLVVLDWLMPGMSGEAVLRQLRTRDPKLPVILMSGYNADRLDCADEHVSRIQKPMTLEQLETAIRNALTPMAAAARS